MCRVDLKGTTRFPRKLLLLALISGVALCANAQDGVRGIEQATTLMNEYFKAGTTLLYVIGAVVGLVGAIKVYNKWSSGDQDTSKAASSWFGACIFLVIVATALKSFFGIS
ncbi:DUF4134 domain-containing protein [Chitinophaga sp. GbtcB8]|uniref:DUF4134 domain-containing protein n=1 Tax=Chitinophaga sp. GbtcB8 TaxID=2824753 RepID=UPI001C2FFF59|nr:DUF4134 domain-containing protein [Chitinophaga sp. GbtcB8]